MSLVFWTDKEGYPCTVSLAKASKTLGELFDAWPRGLKEIDAHIKDLTLRLEEANLKLKDLQEILEKEPLYYEMRSRDGTPSLNFNLDLDLAHDHGLSHDEEAKWKWSAWVRIDKETALLNEETIKRAREKGEIKPFEVRRLFAYSGCLFRSDQGHTVNTQDPVDP